jgi:SNF2 family DNA or RNA helicase
LFQFLLSHANYQHSNLTNASHVIFFSPLLAANKQRYLAYMTQAIGRARRYDQKKVVKIWRLLSLKTIDVNIVEDRERKTLVKGPDGYLLVDRDDIQDGEVAGWRGRAVPVDLGDEDDWEED